MIKKLLTFSNICLITGISAYWLLKERTYSELKTMAYMIDIDIHGYNESMKNNEDKRNYLSLFKYRLQLPKQCIDNFRALKKE